MLVGALLAILGNLLSSCMPSFESMLISRILAGLGSGIYTGVAIANLGGTSKPAKTYNWMLFAFAFSSALEFHLLPQLSMTAIYSIFICSFILGLPLISWIPTEDRNIPLDITLEAPQGIQNILEHRHVPSYIVWLCLLSMFLIYVNIGGYWTYIELAAGEALINSEWTHQLMILGSVSSIAACLVATRLSDKFGLAKPLLLILLMMAGVVGLLYSGIDDFKLAFSLLSFNFLWIFIDVYQMSFIANADRSGVFSSLIPCVQGMGQILGPNIAAYALGETTSYDHVFAICAIFAMLSFVIFFVMYLTLRHQLPALADAT